MALLDTNKLTYLLNAPTLPGSISLVTFRCID